jgi:hypothetical protein
MVTIFETLSVYFIDIVRADRSTPEVVIVVNIVILEMMHLVVVGAKIYFMTRLRPG